MRKLFRMNRLLLCVVFVFASNSAFAVCQKCGRLADGKAMCITLQPQELGATMSACTVLADYSDCDSLGTTAGAECNNAGGGGGGYDGGPCEGNGPENQQSVCVVPSWSTGCSAECATCIVSDSIAPCGP